MWTTKRDRIVFAVFTWIFGSCLAGVNAVVPEMPASIDAIGYAHSLGTLELKYRITEEFTPIGVTGVARQDGVQLAVGRVRWAQVVRVGANSAMSMSELIDHDQPDRPDFPYKGAYAVSFSPSRVEVFTDGIVDATGNRNGPKAGRIWHRAPIQPIGRLQGHVGLVALGLIFPDCDVGLPLSWRDPPPELEWHVFEHGREASISVSERTTFRVRLDDRRRGAVSEIAQLRRIMVDGQERLIPISVLKVEAWRELRDGVWIAERAIWQRFGRADRNDRTYDKLVPSYTATLELLEATPLVDDGLERFLLEWEEGSLVIVEGFGAMRLPPGTRPGAIDIDELNRRHPMQDAPEPGRLEPR